MNLLLCKMWIALALLGLNSFCLGASSFDALNNLDASAPTGQGQFRPLIMPPRQRPVAMQVPVVEQASDESAVQNPELNPVAMTEDEMAMAMRDQEGAGGNDAPSSAASGIPAPEDESDTDNETSSVKRDKRLFFWKKPYYYDDHHHHYDYPRYYNYRRSYPRYYRRPYYRKSAPYFYYYWKW